MYLSQYVDCSRQRVEERHDEIEIDIKKVCPLFERFLFLKILSITSRYHDQDPS